MKIKFFFIHLLVFIAAQCLGAKEITNFDAELEYARLLNNKERYDESLVELHKLLIQKPDSSVVKIEIAKVLYYQGKYSEALQLLQKIPSNEKSDPTRLLEADIYLAAKEYRKAEVIYRDLLEKSPSDDLIKLKLAEMLSWQKRYEESIKLYQEILAARPDDMQVRRKYAMVLMWMGKEDEATNELEKTFE